MILKKYAVLFLILHFLLIGCSSSIEKLEGVSSLDLETDWVMSKIAASPNGAYLSFNVVGNEDQGIYILEIENENYYPVQKDNDRIWYEARGAAWSPDSTSLVALYPSSVVGAPGQPWIRKTPFDIVTIDAKSGDIIYGFWDGSYATWGSNQDEIIILDNDIGKLDQLVPIYQYNTSTGSYKKVGEGYSNHIDVYDGLEVSSTGLLAYFDKKNLIITDLESGEQTGKIKLPSASDPYTLYSPAWSPNGEIIAYIRSKIEDGQMWGNIYFSTSEGSCQGDPLKLETFIRSIDWLPDGQTLVFSTSEPGKIYFLDLNRGVGKELLESFQNECTYESKSTINGE
ncbi:MAG: PD40 domain-containing protein [Ardenticatenaceae bacterium]|nr:PD40 domain-containing protein [Ardenticatenaceae bacterium]MCB8987638.1 PD40 domain-containing protein [Ardenticatenaceae bacterium]